MKYFRLFELQNKYPSIDNYTRENTISSINSLYNHGDAVLTGVFPVNQRRFPLSNIAFIRPVANTTIRFILKVYKSATDEYPRYFTSFNYYAELEQSISVANPYFLNLSLLDTNIVEFDLTDSIGQFKNQLESETARNIKMFKNNFLKIIDRPNTDTKTETYGSDTNSVVKNVEEIATEVIPAEQTLTNDETTTNSNPRGLLGLRRRNVDDVTNDVEPRGLLGLRRRNVDDATNSIISETKNTSIRIGSDLDGITNDAEPRGLLGLRRRNKTEETKTTSIRIGSDVEQTQSENILIDSEKVVAKRIFKASVEPSISDTETKPKSDVEKMVEEVIENPYLDLVDAENQIYVDYRDLCYYLSWCLSSPTLDSVENNGVLTANELSKFEFTTKTNDTDKQDNPSENTGDDLRLETTGKFFEYDIIRLTVPATLEQSKMKFRNQAGEMQEIQTDQYGLVGRFCCEENSWAENHYVYQKTQIGPCGEPNRFSSGGVGGYSGYGYSKEYDTRVGSIDFVNQKRDFENIQ